MSHQLRIYEIFDTNRFAFCAEGEFRDARLTGHGSGSATLSTTMSKCGFSTSSRRSLFARSHD